MSHRVYDPLEVAIGECVESTYAPDKDGYSLMWGGTKYVKHHRFVYCKSNGLPLASITGSHILHICDNTRCVNPEHLRLGTGSLNMADKTMKGRNNVPLGSAHGMAKLTDAIVLEIRANAVYGCIELAARYGIAHQTVSKILRRVSWKHI